MTLSSSSARTHSLRRCLAASLWLLTSCDSPTAEDATLDPATQVVTREPRTGPVTRTPGGPSIASTGPSNGPTGTGSETTPVDDAPEGSPDDAPSGWNLCSTLALRARTPLVDDARVSWAELLCELVDLDRFVRGPANYTTAMASSRDPSSKVEGEPSWFANNDFGHFLRDDGAEHVLLDQRGPGVLTRFWSANPTGVLRIYIDDQPKPALEIDFARFFRGGAPEPMRAPFAYVSGKGANLIFPIPYSSAARVTISGSGPKLFYQIDHRRYPEGTQVEPYSLAGAQKLIPLAREVKRVLDDPRQLRDIAALTAHTLKLDDAQPEQRASIGPSVVRELTLRGFQPTDQWLRTTRLIMTVDGARAVDAPVSSLFTADLGPGNAPHASIATSVARDALTLRWPIAVKGELGIRLESNGGRIGNVTVELSTSAGVPADALQFHAQWTGARTFDTVTPVDWTLAHLRGKGFYVGTVLNIANPVVEWWGEGDEKIFVDGASAPSIFGTGTEDYFGYAWCANHTFATPWNGQPRYDGAFNWGRASMYRFHVIEAIPFASELRFNLEVQHWRVGADAIRFTEDALALWYATPDTVAAPRELAITDFQLPRIETERPLWLLPYDCEFLSLLP